MSYQLILLFILVIALINQHAPIYHYNYISRRCFGTRLRKFIRNCPHESICEVREICNSIIKNVPAYTNVMEVVYLYKLLYDTLYKQHGDIVEELPQLAQQYFNIYKHHSTAITKRLIISVVQRKITLLLTLHQPNLSYNNKAVLRDILAKDPKTHYELVSYDKELKDVAGFLKNGVKFVMVPKLQRTFTPRKSSYKLLKL